MGCNLTQEGEIDIYMTSPEGLVPTPILCWETGTGNPLKDLGNGTATKLLISVTLK